MNSFSQDGGGGDDIDGGADGADGVKDNLGNDGEIQVDVCYENFRYYPGVGWSSNLLPTDVFCWSSEDGKNEFKKEQFPVRTGFQVIADWRVSPRYPRFSDQLGWEYAFDFPKPSLGVAYSWSPVNSNSFVRRRRWIRVKVRVFANDAVTRLLRQSQVDENKKKWVQEVKKIENGGNSEAFVCRQCQRNIGRSYGTKLSCGHQACNACLRHECAKKMETKAPAACPVCADALSAADVHHILSAEERKKFSLGADSKASNNNEDRNSSNADANGDLLGYRPSTGERLQEGVRTFRDVTGAIFFAVGAVESVQRLKHLFS
mmetsp:Transcript_16747/g.23444  ORF Transcript_16747/g.23444 Transcript_16747/m.23444 type:complete len:318 (+) Transcript_16747:62-1015(+)